MKPNKTVFLALAASIAAVAQISPARADLPVMDSKEWLGYFIGVGTKDSRFTIDTKGKMVLRILNKKGEPLADAIGIGLDYVIEEKMPDGKYVAKRLNPETLECAEQPTDKLNKEITIKGKVTGDAGFELYVSQNRGAISVGGKVTEPGTLKNPLRFTITAKIPNVYYGDNPGADPVKLRAFEAKTSKDKFQVLRLDGKKVRQETNKAVSLASPEIMGTGISVAQMEYHAYEEHRITLTASPNSAMLLENDPSKPVYAGTRFIWSADAAKDPKAAARLSIEVK